MTPKKFIGRKAISSYSIYVLTPLIRTTWCCYVRFHDWVYPEGHILPFDVYDIYRILLGPPVGGALYERFGFRGPFILGIIFAFVDLVGRLFIIEVKPQAEADTLTPADEEREKSEPEPDNSPDNTRPLAEVNLTFAQVIMALARSSRACTAALISLVFG